MLKGEPSCEVNLFDHPKLHQSKAILKLSKALGSLERFFEYGSLKGDILFIYFSHPIGVSEFNLKKEQILREMRKIYKQESLKSVLVFKEVKAKLVVGYKEEKIPKKDRFAECATGEFDISHIKNPKIKKAFERIKKLIKHNREADND